jgi:hypothetical protein
MRIVVPRYDLFGKLHNRIRNTIDWLLLTTLFYA